jgi:hypothetical protein
MFRAVKTLLIWLLLAALPVQGFAAAAMMSCRPIQHAAFNTDAGMRATKYAHDDMATHAHHHHVDHAPETSTAEHGKIAHHDENHHSHGKHDASTSCSVCAVCCIGAAPLPFGLNWTFVRNKSEPVLVSPPQFVTGFIPAALERPPRFDSI